MTIAARARDLADGYVIGDALAPLVAIWRSILDTPDALADGYEALWGGLTGEDRAYFNRIRDRYNAAPEPAALLYLLARCVKNAPRFNRAGAFSQSADHRRAGMRPQRMRRQIRATHDLLRGATVAVAAGAEETLAAAGPEDLVYMDPPWQGTTEGRDKRYVEGFPRSRIEALLADLNERGVPWVMSYDGRSGTTRYGAPLSSALAGSRIELPAGRSAQATLNGVAAQTVESLYLARCLAISPGTPAGAGCPGTPGAW